MKLTPELMTCFSPYRTSHLNRFGLFELKERYPLPVDYGIIFGMIEVMRVTGHYYQFTKESLRLALKGLRRGAAIFAKAFMGLPAQQAAKITRPVCL